MASTTAGDGITQQVLTLVQAVPRGKVTSYGAIADCLGISPRQVARVLATLDGAHARRRGIPWHRIVASSGVVSSTAIPGGPGPRQIALLRKEGHRITPTARIADFDAAFHLPVWRGASAPAQDSTPRRQGKKSSPREKK